MLWLNGILCCCEIANICETSSDRLMITMVSQTDSQPVKFHNIFVDRFQFSPLLPFAIFAAPNDRKKCRTKQNEERQLQFLITIEWRQCAHQIWIEFVLESHICVEPVYFSMQQTNAKWSVELFFVLFLPILFPFFFISIDCYIEHIFLEKAIQNETKFTYEPLSTICLQWNKSFKVSGIIINDNMVNSYYVLVFHMLLEHKYSGTIYNIILQYYLR